MGPRVKVTTRFRGAVRRLVAVTAVLSALMLNGCLPDGLPWPVRRPPCVFETRPTKRELVDYLNRRTRQLASWRSNDASVKTYTALGLPIRLSAMISVERPRNFRLVAHSAFDHEADFGSNDERFWFWMRSSKVKRVFTIRHADLHNVRGRLPIPFRTDWVMESLGVIPLKAEAITMVPGEPGRPIVHLVSEDTTPGGQSIRRVIVVDYCAGQVTRQSLFDSDGQEIARADFSRFEAAANAPLILPHRIDLKWPKAKTEMSLTLGTIEANPRNVDPSLFALPSIEGYPVWQMGTHVVGAELGRNAMPITRRPNQRRTQQPGRVQITSRGTQPAGRLPRSGPPQFVEDSPETKDGSVHAGFQPPNQFRKPLPFPGSTDVEPPDFVED
ncbi:MAG: hypothetical protein ACE5KM_07895 [Planctomycetaceae bacterium]